MAKRIYPWEAWLRRVEAGKKVRLHRGADYACSQSAMVQQIRDAASHLGVSIRIRDTNSGLVIEPREATDALAEMA